MVIYGNPYRPSKPRTLPSYAEKLEVYDMIIYNSPLNQDPPRIVIRHINQHGPLHLQRDRLTLKTHIGLGCIAATIVLLIVGIMASLIFPDNAEGKPALWIVYAIFIAAILIQLILALHLPQHFHRTYGYSSPKTNPFPLPALIIGQIFLCIPIAPVDSLLCHVLSSASISEAIFYLMWVLELLRIGSMASILTGLLDDLRAYRFFCRNCYQNIPFPEYTRLHSIVQATNFQQVDETASL